MSRGFMRVSLRGIQHPCDGPQPSEVKYYSVPLGLRETKWVLTISPIVSINHLAKLIQHGPSPRNTTTLLSGTVYPKDSQVISQELVKSSPSENRPFFGACRASAAWANLLLHNIQ